MFVKVEGHGSKPILDALVGRTSTNHYDPSSTLSDEVLTELVRLAVRAPTAFNFQNWRFIAVRTREAKETLWEASYRQPKVLDAAATFIICGQLPDHTLLAARLQPSVEAGIMPAAMAADWVEKAARDYGTRPQKQRDEAVRSAVFGAAALIFAASAFGLATGPMGGFDPQKVARDFHLAPDEIPVLLLSVGVGASGNWPQKPRRALGEVLEFV